MSASSILSVPPSRCPAYIALAGPTASGKTALALALVAYIRQRWGVESEIISVDSALVYRGMDIGTAKPSAAEQAQATHHLLDVLDPTESYSAARFATDARRIMADVAARGRLPLLVGGTMLYFKALFDGLNDLPPAQPHWREQIQAEARQHGWPALHARLAAVDPVTAQRLPPHDSQRIGRALEVWYVTGMPLSQWHAQDTPHGHACPPTLLLSLEPGQRQWLHTRIAQRFDAMLAAGFLDEMQALRQRSDLHPDLPSMRCVGYRQAWQALDAGTPLEVWREQAIAATRQLAKRQLTWLRSMPQRVVLACDADGTASSHAAVPVTLPAPASVTQKVWQGNDDGYTCLHAGMQADRDETQGDYPTSGQRPAPEQAPPDWPAPLLAQAAGHIEQCWHRLRPGPACIPLQSHSP